METRITSSTFGKRLAEQREHLGLTQEELCKLAGISRKTQFVYEKDHGYPDAGYLMLLHKHGFDVLYLLSGERPPPFGTVHEELLRAVLATIDEESAKATLVLDASRKAKLAAIVYRTSARTGLIDSELVSQTISLIS